MPRAYPHMCRMDHVEIGHADSSEERCPLCRAIDDTDYVRNQLSALQKRYNRLARFARVRGYDPVAIANGIPKRVEIGGRVEVEG